MGQDSTFWPYDSMVEPLLLPIIIESDNPLMPNFPRTRPVEPATNFSPCQSFCSHRLGRLQTLQTAESNLMLVGAMWFASSVLPHRVP